VVTSDILSSRWYVRVNAGVNEMRDLFGDLQALARGGAPAGEIAFLTREMTEPEVREKLSGLDVGSVFRVLG
jgi:homoserine dehydrogenase